MHLDVSHHLPPTARHARWRKGGSTTAGLDPKAFTIRNAATHLGRTQAWRGYARSARPLRAAIEKLLRKGG